MVEPHVSVCVTWVRPLHEHREFVEAHERAPTVQPGRLLYCRLWSLFSLVTSATTQYGGPHVETVNNETRFHKVKPIGCAGRTDVTEALGLQQECPSAVAQRTVAPGDRSTLQDSTERRRTKKRLLFFFFYPI